MAIEHVVIIVKENHTLDNYFGTLPGRGWSAARARGESTAGRSPS